MENTRPTSDVTIARALEQLRSIDPVKQLGDTTLFEASTIGLTKFKTSIGKLPGENQELKVEDCDELTYQKWLRERATASARTFNRRELKRLCWKPEVLADELFHPYLLSNLQRLSSSAMRGLVFCYQANWKGISGDEKQEVLIKRIFERKNPRGELLSFIKTRSEQFFSASGPRVLAIEACKNCMPLSELFKKFGVVSTTHYSAEIARNSVDVLLENSDHLDFWQIKFLFEGLLSAQVMTKKRLKWSIARVINSRCCESDPAVQQGIVDFVFRREDFGDPRIHPENWIGVEEEAKAKLIQWLAKEDIEFFFNLIIRADEDPHKRKDYWMKYVSKVQRSRAFLSYEDQRRHKIKLDELKERGRGWGDLSGTTSAFVLDFGPIVVVEFNRTGNACYIYMKKDFEKLLPNFWIKQTTVSALKDPDVVEARISHMNAWENEATLKLVRNGIRPGN